MSGDEVSQIFSLDEVCGFLRRRGLVITLIALFGGFLGFYLSGLLPKQFKSKATVTIQAGYFHHPLVSDSVGEIQDTGEMSAHRMALIRASLNDAFLEAFGRRYLFPLPVGHTTPKPLDPEMVLKKIDYFSTNSTSFQLSITTKSRETAFEATKEVLHQIVSSLARQRRETLLQTRLALIHQAEELLASFSQSSPVPNVDNVRTDLASTEAKIAELEGRLSETHPDVVAMKARLTALRSNLPDGQPPNEEPLSGTPSIFRAPQSRTANQEIFDELLRKISGLSVVIDMESARETGAYIDIIEHPRAPLWPFAPSQIQFGVIGGVIGLVLGLAQAVVFELRRRLTISREEVEHFLGIPCLGEMPHA